MSEALQADKEYGRNATRTGDREPRRNGNGGATTEVATKRRRRRAPSRDADRMRAEWDSIQAASSTSRGSGEKPTIWSPPP